VKSEIANLKNDAGRPANQVGMFLKHFAKETPWVHLDMPVQRIAEAQRGSIPKETGVAVRTLAPLAWDVAESGN
jgi:leucyl aminopeptidase